jgi:uncharacterized protein DUF4190
MKYCPQCQRRFDEAWLSFCSDDGTPLIQELTPPADPNWNPKIRGPQVQTPDEQETQWLPKEPPLPGAWIAPDERPPMSPAPWEQRPPATPAPWQPPPPPSPYAAKQLDQGLAVASMVVGIAGVVLLGCLGPIPGIVSLVLGLVALSQINKSPERYGGKPYAKAGVIIGGLTVAFYVLLAIGWFLAAVLS